MMASWGVNTVRIPLNQDCWLGTNGKPAGGLTASGYKAAVQSWVRTLEQHGMAVILDLHWLGNNQGQLEMADQASPAFWADVAGTFKDDPSVMFDAFNEPYARSTLGYSLSWSCWRDGGCNAPVQSDLGIGPDPSTTYVTSGMQALRDAIRGAGARQPILLGGLDYANNLARATAGDNGAWLAYRPVDPATGAPDDQLVASFHNYQGETCQSQVCWDSEIAPVASQVPVITGEFAQDHAGDTFDESYMTWADNHCVGYLAWEWIINSDDPHALLQDPAGTPTAINGYPVMSHLQNVAGADPCAG
jgi:hypothetical protein